MWWFGIREFLDVVTGMPGGLALEIDGELVEIGAVGEESVTLPGVKGMTILADLDGDGIVDHVTTHDYSGGFEVWSRGDAGPEWGLPTDVSIKPSTGWGLESEATPGKGREISNCDSPDDRWMCVDRG